MLRVFNIVQCICNHMTMHIFYGHQHMFILAAAKEMPSYKQKVVSVCISHKIHSLFLWISEMLDTVWWFTMQKFSYQNPLSTSLHNIQSFSFSCCVRCSMYAIRTYIIQVNGTMGHLLLCTMFNVRHQDLHYTSERNCGT